MFLTNIFFTLFSIQSVLKAPGSLNLYYGLKLALGAACAIVSAAFKALAVEVVLKWEKWIFKI